MLQSNRNQENAPLWLLVCYVQDMFYLFLKIANFADRCPRQANQDDIAGTDRLADCKIPVLPGQNIFFVKPALNPVV